MAYLYNILNMIISANFPLANAVKFIHIRMQMQKNKETKVCFEKFNMKENE